MSIRIVTPPAAEPVALGEMKTVLRIDHDDEDALIEALIRAARERVEAATGRALITRGVVETLDRWPARGGPQRLGVSPVSAVTEVRTRTAAGAATVLAADRYYADLAANPPRLVLISGAHWPLPGRGSGGIEIQYTAGYGDTPDDVPEALRQAVREIAAEAYDRGGVQGALAPATQALLAPFRRVRL